MKCRTGRFRKVTVLLAIALFIINTINFSIKFVRQTSQTTTLSDVSLDRNTYWNQTTISDSLFPRNILYKNTYWQVHTSLVNLSLCHEDKNVSRKSKECFPNRNNTKNFSTHEEVVAYSSFFDDRSTHVSSRWVQVLAVVKMVPNPSPIFCQIWLRENYNLENKKLFMASSISRGKASESFGMTLLSVHLNASDLHGMTGKPPTWIFEVQPVSHTTGRNHNFPNISYGQRQFSCPMTGVHPYLVPTHVSLTFKRGERSTILMPVQYPEENKLSTLDHGNKAKQNNNDNSSLRYKHEFVICVTQAYGYINPMELIEWMEFHKILGVSKISIYNGTILPDETLDLVVRHYIETGLLSLYQIPPAVLNQSNAILANELSSPASLNDCMMRYMKSARWVIVVDFDEVILPTRVDSYAALMEQLKETHKTSPKSHHRLKVDELTPHTYVFRMAYFLRNSSLSNSTSMETLFTSKYRWRSPHLDVQISPKSFVDPRHCLSVFNHYCWVTWDGKAQKKFVVDPAMAFVHHYRKSCSLSKEECNRLAAKNVLDNNADRFQMKLLEQVTRAKKDIFK